MARRDVVVEEIVVSSAISVRAFLSGISDRSSLRLRCLYCDLPRVCYVWFTQLRLLRLVAGDE
jgi:hypothetical protein